MSSPRTRCKGCEDSERLGRRRFVKLLATGAALVLSGCAAAVRQSEPSTSRRTKLPLAGPSPIIASPDAGPPLTLDAFPAPKPGLPSVIRSGPSSSAQIALTVDDGYCGECIARYIEFAQASGIHITFNPNGVFGSLWTPSIVRAVRGMVADRQVQIGNHTWNHANLLSLSNDAVRSEINRNEHWIEQTFGVTARPYLRPPYGNFDHRVASIAGELGYTRILMWNGTFGDATVETPQQIIALAEQWLRPGTIMLGHLNHTPILGLFNQIESIIKERNLEPVTLDEMFGSSRATG